MADTETIYFYFSVTVIAVCLIIIVVLLVQLRKMKNGKTLHDSPKMLKGATSLVQTYAFWILTCSAST